MSARSIFLLTWRDQEAQKFAYDCNLKAIIVADAEIKARALMQERTADEGLFALNPQWRNLRGQEQKDLFKTFQETQKSSPFWLSSKFSNCTIIGEAAKDAPDGIVCLSHSIS